MKKIFVLAVCLTLVFCLSGCGFIQFMPSADEIGESKTFEKDGIKLLLTDAYEEQVSEVGFYGYYVADFGAVMVERTTFKEHPEYEGMTLDQFAEAYRNDNGHSMAIEHDDELVYYVSEKGGRTYYVFFYLGTDSFWTVQYACYTKDAPTLEFTFMLFAAAVEVE